MSKEQPFKPWNEKEWQDKIGIFRSFLSKPNESVWDLSDLWWGRDRYEHIVEVTPNTNKENEKFYLRTEFGHWRLRPEWRTLLDRPDRYARMPIHIDPTYEWCNSDGGVMRREYRLWEPQRLLNSCTASQAIVDDVLRVINAVGISDTRKLTSTVNGHFRANFLKQEEGEWKSLRMSDEGEWWCKMYAEVNWEQHKQKVLRFWEDSVHLVAGCLLHNFQVWPESWLDKLFDSEAVEEEMFEAKRKLAHIRSGGMIYEFD